MEGKRRFVLNMPHGQAPMPRTDDFLRNMHPRKGASPFYHVVASRVLPRKRLSSPFRCLCITVSTTLEVVQRRDRDQVLWDIDRPKKAPTFPRE